MTKRREIRAAAARPAFILSGSQAGGLRRRIDRFALATMFHHTTRLPHILPPQAYVADDQFRREVAALFRDAPLCVATTMELAKPGDFLTMDLLGKPLQLRNVDGEIRAYSNVCAHRHCLLTSRTTGNSPKLRCQYHGWEYDADGKTAHIPQPKNFVPFDRDQDRLGRYRAETCGRLVFVTLGDDAPTLRERLGENFEPLAERFDERWASSWTWQTRLDVNWKIPIENSLEGYHIPAVHPETFKVAPTADRTTHVLETEWTLYRTPYVAPSAAERALFAVERRALRILRRTPSAGYSHYHFFPNLLVSSSDMFSLAVSVLPVSPTRTELRVRQFTYRGVDPNPIGRFVSAFWSRLNRFLARKVLAEDFSIYPAIQRGLAASDRAGCLGTIEERVHAFQAYVAAHTQYAAGPSTADSAARLS